jgi:hypothetical protein
MSGNPEGDILTLTFVERKYISFRKGFRKGR